MMFVGDFLEDLSHFLLACMYALLAVVATHMRFLHPIKASKKTIWQSAFSIALMLGVVLRGVFFFLQPFFHCGVLLVPNKLNFILSTLPSFFFLSCYQLVIFVWAEIYHDISGGNTSNLRPICFGIQGSGYITLIILFILDVVHGEPEVSPGQPQIVSVYEKAIMIYDACIYFFSALGFCVYGISFVCKLQGYNQPLLANMRQRVLPKVKILTIMCTVTFIVRGCLTFWNAFDNFPNGRWYVDGLYYTFLEIFPIFCMLVIIRPTQSHAEEEQPINAGGDYGYAVNTPDISSSEEVEDMSSD